MLSQRFSAVPLVHQKLNVAIFPNLNGIRVHQAQQSEKLSYLHVDDSPFYSIFGRDFIIYILNSCRSRNRGRFYFICRSNICLSIIIIICQLCFGDVKGLCHFWWFSGNWSGCCTAPSTERILPGCYSKKSGQSSSYCGQIRR